MGFPSIGSELTSSTWPFAVVIIKSVAAIPETFFLMAPYFRELLQEYLSSGRLPRGLAAHIKSNPISFY
jgi:hypothetical protein